MSSWFCSCNWSKFLVRNQHSSNSFRCGFPLPHNLKRFVPFFECSRPYPRFELGMKEWRLLHLMKEWHVFHFNHFVSTSIFMWPLCNFWICWVNDWYSLSPYFSLWSGLHVAWNSPEYAYDEYLSKKIWRIQETVKLLWQYLLKKIFSGIKTHLRK